jgi:CheY-like chemotaxis protein
MPGRVLIVEDDRSIRDLLKTILSLDGYGIDIAMDGNEAIAALDKNPFDAILLDLMMPKTNGYEVIHHVASKKLGIPIVIATAAVKQIDNSRIDRNVVVAVIKKPFDIDAVRDAVADAVKSRTA